MVGMLAVETPVRKLVAIGGVTLALAAFAHHPHAAHSARHHLTLHAPPPPDRTVYMTVFAQGHLEESTCDLHSIVVTLPDERQPIEFTTRLHYWGCDWLGVERLVPSGDHFDYSYDETKLRCEPDAPPTITTPRTGIVTVDD
jgi:hypothetical protein